MEVLVVSFSASQGLAHFKGLLQEALFFSLKRQFPKSSYVEFSTGLTEVRRHSGRTKSTTSDARLLLPFHCRQVVE